MGTTHGDPDTWPRIGNIIGFITRADLITISTAIVTTQRDFGNRTLRKRARFKYTIDDRGLDCIVGEIAAARPASHCSQHDRLYSNTMGTVTGLD